MIEISLADLPELVPAFFEARILAHPHFNDIYVLIVDPGDTENDILTKLATKIGAGGKYGEAVLILPIETAEDDLEDASSGPLKFRITFQVVENRRINKSASGTKKAGYGTARVLHQLFKHFSARGLFKLLVPDKPAIQRVPPPEGHEKKLRLWGVNFVAREDVTLTTEKVALPVFSRTGNEVTLTCATAGAQIYFTTDGTPASANAKSAQVYSGPIPIPADGLLLFVMAAKEGSLDSDTTSKTFNQT